VQRWLFLRELERLGNVPVFYLDECGVDHRLYRERGRARRGERIYQEISGRRPGTHEPHFGLPKRPARRAVGVSRQL
jgi:hypothetical protein